MTHAAIVGIQHDIAQIGARAAETAGDRAFGKVQHGGGFRIGIAFDTDEHDDFALLARQIEEMIADRQSDGSAFGRLSTEIMDLLGRADDGQCAFCVRALAVVIAKEVLRDSEEPAVEARTALPFVQIADRTFARLLDEVVSVGARSGQRKREAGQRRQKGQKLITGRFIIVLVVTVHGTCRATSKAAGSARRSLRHAAERRGQRSEGRGRTRAFGMIDRAHGVRLLQIWKYAAMLRILESKIRHNSSPLQNI
ncbi:MAG: hypothetical protein R3F54_07620 [Alphaproteobacteria bacterium]